MTVSSFQQLLRITTSNPIIPPTPGPGFVCWPSAREPGFSRRNLSATGFKRFCPDGLDLRLSLWCWQTAAREKTKAFVCASDIWWHFCSFLQKTLRALSVLRRFYSQEHNIIILFYFFYSFASQPASGLRVKGVGFLRGSSRVLPFLPSFFLAPVFPPIEIDQRTLWGPHLISLHFQETGS